MIKNQASKDGRFLESQNKQKEYYKKLAKKFDKIKKRENRNHINKIIAISNFLKIKKGDRVLEIGVGTGIHANYLLKLNKNHFEFTGIDLSKDMLSEAKKKLKNYSNIKLMQMDGENLKFKDNSFDFAYTPPFPKKLIPIYNATDKIINKIPFLRRVSVMLFVKGEKTKMLETIIEKIKYFKSGSSYVSVKEPIINARQLKKYLKDINEADDSWRKNPRDFIYHPKS